MKSARVLILIVPFFLFAVGCGSTPSTSKPAASVTQKDPHEVSEAEGVEADIHAALAELPPEDRQLAEAQRYCAVEDENRLGAMGKPFKVTLKDRTVFLCCKGCKKIAERDPEKTLAKVDELKDRAAERNAK
jgi:hypothetical protein